MSGAFEGRCFLVCVTGCIGAYKACELVREFQRRGARVKVLMSEHAKHFVEPTTFRALTHESVAIGLFDDPSDPIHHISLAKEADVIVVAPATANVIAKMTLGIADDLLSTTLLAATSPIVVAPAMNSAMWRAVPTQQHIAELKRRGVTISGPGTGYLACGDVDEGRLEDISRIADDTEQALLASQEVSGEELSGEHVLITAGPTHEPIDPVRFIGNRSSGKMGIALARAAHALGARVTLVLGPVDLSVPAGIEVIHVETAAQMRDAAVNAFQDATIAICAAAVADYTPATPADHKLKKGIEPLDEIRLVPTADILKELSTQKGERTIIGFAAETGDPVEYARQKLMKKGCDAIVANDVTRSDSGFGTDTNKAWWVTSDGANELPVLSKDDLARVILKRARDL